MKLHVISIIAALHHEYDDHNIRIMIFLPMINLGVDWRRIDNRMATPTFLLFILSLQWCVYSQILDSIILESLDSILL